MNNLGIFLVFSYCKKSFKRQKSFKIQKIIVFAFRKLVTQKIIGKFEFLLFFSFFLFLFKKPSQFKNFDFSLKCYELWTFFQLNGNGDKWHIRTTFFKTKVSVAVSDYLSLQFMWFQYFPIYEMLKPLTIEYSFIKVCHDIKKKLVLVNKLQVKKLIGHRETQESFLFSSFQRVRIHHFFRSIERRQSPGAWNTWARW